MFGFLIYPFLNQRRNCIEAIVILAKCVRCHYIKQIYSPDVIILITLFYEGSILIKLFNLLTSIAFNNKENTNNIHYKACTNNIKTH